MHLSTRIGIIGLLVGGLIATAANATTMPPGKAKGPSSVRTNAKVSLGVGNPAGSCDGDVGGAPRGSINFHRDGDDVRVDVHVRDAQPNGNYAVFVRCVGFLGYLQTNSKGDGKARFGTTWSPGFSIDMHETVSDDYISSAPFPQD